MTGNVTTRHLVAADEPLLAHAMLGNLNWSGLRFTERDVQSRSEFRHYTQLALDRGDFGFVAERAEQEVGVGWAQFLPAHDPGFGFLDESTPEISLWVRAGSRGQGVGRMLLRQLQQEASRRGIARLSLSVEADNYARQLYASQGFTDVVGREADGVMLWVP